MTQGYFLIAIGKYYIDECYQLAQTIRKQGDTRPISLLVNPDDIEYARSKDMFDQFVEFAPNDTLWNSCNTSFEKYCLYPRVMLNEYLPYDENITVDSDMICQYSPEKVWSYFASKTSPIGMLGRKNDPNWHWGYIGEVSKAFGQHVPHVHGGFFYTKKCYDLDRFFAYCRFVFYEYDRYGCRRMFRGGKVDEIIFAIAHSFFKMYPTEFDQFPVMTFNYSPDIEVPSKLQTENQQNIMMDDYIPFVHMFDKMEGANYKALYDKVMK